MAKISAVKEEIGKVLDSDPKRRANANRIKKSLGRTKEKSIQVVINTKFGGFNLSDEVIEECIKRGMKLTAWTEDGDYEDKDADFVEWETHSGDTKRICGSRYSCCRESDKAFRTHPTLLAAIRKVGVRKSSGRFCQLKIITIPFADTNGWHIDEYDGMESVEEDHRSWC